MARMTAHSSETKPEWIESPHVQPAAIPGPAISSRSYACGRRRPVRMATGSEGGMNRRTRPFPWWEQTSPNVILETKTSKLAVVPFRVATTLAAACLTIVDQGERM